MSRTTTALLLATLVGAGACQKDPDALSKLAEKLDYGQTPRLPPPESNSYATGEESARDPVIGELVQDRFYEGALAGAASGLALEIAEGEGSLTRWELREALWKAGFAYPVYDARRWDTVLSGPPPRELIGWLEDIPATEKMALVRARGRDRDHWVGMRARIEVDLGVLPRLADLGSPLRLPPVAGATWTIADGQGRLRKGALDDGADILLATMGEWLVLVEREGRTLARFPVYVGVDGPAMPVLSLDGPIPPIADAEDADNLARSVLASVRQVYGQPAWKPDTLFDATLKKYLDAPSVGIAPVLESVGFGGSFAEVWACDDVTVLSCIDQWLWDPKRRDVLLTKLVDAYGLHTVIDSSGIHLTLLLVDASAEP